MNVRLTPAGRPWSGRRRIRPENTPRRMRKWESLSICGLLLSCAEEFGTPSVSDLNGLADTIVSFLTIPGPRRTGFAHAARDPEGARVSARRGPHAFGTIPTTCSIFARPEHAAASLAKTALARVLPIEWRRGPPSVIRHTRPEEAHTREGVGFGLSRWGGSLSNIKAAQRASAGATRG